MRRLQEDGGYLGLTLVRDCRQDGNGYDFLCRSATDGIEMEVELKTYAPGGSLHLTLGEIERARTSGASYVLIGLIDDGGNPTGWNARRMDNPHATLIRIARARLDIDFSIPAVSVFPL